MRFWIAIAVIAAGIGLLALNHDAGTIAGLDNDDFASLLQLGLIALLVSGALLATGPGLGGAIRSLLMWIGIGALLVVGYAYKDDLKLVATRSISVLVPGVAIESTPAGDELQVFRSRDGHFRISAKLNGARATMLVDTGATSTTLTARDAERAGLDMKRLSYTVPVRTANGRTTVAPAVVEEFEVGSLSYPSLRVFVARPGQLEQSLLGLSFLEKLSSYEVRGDRLFLRK